MSERIYKHSGYTLVDITKTDITQYTSEMAKMRNKHRNWETLVQVLSLRTQILSIRQLQTVRKNLNQYEFGSAYRGSHRIWSFEFSVEFLDLYKIDDSEYQLLETDFAQTPVITKLDETIDLPQPLFYTAGPNKNIYFKSIP
jgi:hypothetical protein